MPMNSNLIWGGAFAVLIVLTLVIVFYFKPKWDAEKINEPFESYATNPGYGKRPLPPSLSPVAPRYGVGKIR